MLRAAAFLDGGSRREAPDPLESPPSGVRPCALPSPAEALRDLAREAESLDLEELAFELFFAAMRVESIGPTDAVRRDLAEVANEVSALEARYYRRALRALQARTMR